MTFQQWYNQTIGRPIDIDRAFGDQCVDVYLSYIQNVIGVQNWSMVSGFGDAKDLYTKANPQYFSKLTGITPQQGDVVVFGPTSTNPYGHIAVVVSATPSNMTVIEQNGFNPSGVAYTATRPYNNVTGYLRPIGGDMIQDGDIAQIRIIMSEVEGWNGNEIHAGKYDAQIKSAWVGHTWNEFIYHCWTVQPKHRQVLVDTISQLQTQVNNFAQADITDKAELQEAQDKATQLSQDLAKAQADLVATQEANKKALDEANAQKSEDTQLLDQGKGVFAWITKLIERLKK